MKLFGCSILFAGLVFAQGNANDMRFAKDAAIGGMTEVEMGKIAVQKGTNDQVKALGQMLVDDHSKMNDQLKQLAAKDNFTLPTSLDPKHQAEVNKFQKMSSGAAFDRAFLREAVADHTADIGKFQTEANAGNNQDLKNLASSALPTLQNHLSKAQAAQNAVGSMSRK